MMSPRLRRISVATAIMVLPGAPALADPLPFPLPPPICPTKTCLPKPDAAAPLTTSDGPAAPATGPRSGTPANTRRTCSATAGRRRLTRRWFPSSRSDRSAG